MLLLVAVLAARAGAALEAERALAEVDRLRVEHNVPGAALALVDGGGIHRLDGFGVADLETAEPMTGDTLLRIGSITKAFTGLAMLMLEQNGRLRLTDRVVDHLAEPPYRNPWRDSHPVRIAHLLEHTAGFEDLSREEWDSKDPSPLPLEQAFAVRRSPRVLQWPPGRHSSYSNVGAGIAGLILEAVSGQGYETWMAARIFAPLGMTRTNLLYTERVAGKLATGYDSDGRTPIPYWHMIYRPFGAINTTARDMAAFVQLLLERGSHGGRTLLPAAAVARMERPATTLAARGGLRYGYGLGIYQYVREGALLYGHGGDADGYLAHFAYSRDSGRGFVLIINTFKRRAIRAMRAPLERWLVAGVAAAEPPVAALDPARLAQYAGRYEPATVRFPWRAPGELRVALSGARLYTRVDDGRRRALLPVDETRFRRPGQPVATAAFVRDEDGRLYLQGDMGNWRRTDSP